MTPPIGSARSGIIGSQVADAIPDSGILRWKFDEGSGSTATDAWGSHDGSITGATYTTTAKVGSHALDLDGTDDDVLTGNNPFTPSSGGYTITFRGNPTTLSGIPVSHEVRVGFEYNPNGNSELTGFYQDSGGFARITGGSSAVVSTGTWVYGGITWDGSNWNLYIDGSNVASESGGEPDFSGVDRPFAAGSNGLGSGYHEGIVDDVRAYDKGLSSTEHSDLYNTGSISG